MGSYFSQLVHEAILSDGDSSLKLHGVKLSKKEASTYAAKLVEQLGSRLHYLSIDRAKLKAVPVEICGGLSVLKHVQLVGNNLSDLPGAFSKMKTVTTVILTDNEFARVPAPLMQCGQLCKLDFSKNQLKALPDTFGDSLANLEVLRLAQNRLEDATAWPSILKLGRLRELDVSSNLLKSIPSGMSSALSSLQELNLSHNDIPSIENLTRMTSLRVLLLSRLTLDPSSFASSSHSAGSSGDGGGAKTLLTLPKLDVLDLSHNKIVSLATEVFVTLTKLTTLKLHNNKMLRLPKEIGALTALQSLYLQENQLFKIGKQLAQCSNLEVLRLEFNNLTKLPAAMRSMSKLHCLMLHHNRFKIIPEPLYDATFVSHLYTLSLEDNPLTPDILKHIAEKGTREYVLERECRLREEEEAAGKRKGRPSLTRIASQYGSLRGGTTGPPAGSSAFSKRPGLSLGTFSSGTNPGYGTLRGSRLAPTDPAAPLTASASAIPPEQTDPSDPLNATAAPAPSTAPSTPEKAKRGAIPASLRLTRSPSSSQIPTNNARTFTRSKTNTTNTPTTPVPVAMGPDGPVMVPVSARGSTKSSTPAAAPSSQGRSISSASRVSGSALSLSQIVKSDHTLEVPPFSRFKEAFEFLMEQEDMSDARREELRKASVEAKWELMRIYKGTLVQLLSNNTARIEREKKFEAWQKVDKKIERLASPQYFISSLRGHNISMPDMNTLKSMFESAPLPWVYEFIDFGGITELARFMMQLFNANRGKDKSAQDIVKETDAISCMSVLASASSSLVLAAPDAIFGVVLCLASDQLAAIKPALKLLVQIHSEHMYTSKVILQALERAKVVLNTPHRFSLFINLLSDLPHLKQDYEVKADMLSLIGKMCDSMPLIDRYILRNELNKVGLERALIELNTAPHHALQQQLAAIEEASFADSEAVKTLAATDYRVLLRIQEQEGSQDDVLADGEMPASLTGSQNLSAETDSPETARNHSHSSAASSVVPSPTVLPLSNANVASAPVYIDNLKIIVGDLGTNNVRIMPTSTIADVIKKILQRYTIDHPELYRILFLSSNTAKMEGIWAEDPTALVADFVGKFNGECIASFKMKPFKLNVDCTFAKMNVLTELEPTWSIQQTIAHIVTTNKFSIDSDYQLSVLLDPHELEDESADVHTPTTAKGSPHGIVIPVADPKALTEEDEPSTSDEEGKPSTLTTSASTDSAAAATSDISTSASDDSIPIIIRTGSSTKVDSSTSDDKISSNTSPSKVNIPTLSLPGSNTSTATASTETAATAATADPKLTVPSSTSPTVTPRTSPRSASPRGTTPRFSVVAGVPTNVTTEPYSSSGLSRSPRGSVSNGGDRSESSDSLASSSSRNASTELKEPSSAVGESSESSTDPTLASTEPSSATVGESQSTESTAEKTSETTPDKDTASPAPEKVDEPGLEESSVIQPTPAVDMPSIPIPSLYHIPTVPTVLPLTAMAKEPRRVILSDSDTLHSLKYSEFSMNDLLTGKVVLQLALKPTKLKIFMGDEGVMMEVDARWSIAELLRHIALKVPEVQDTIADYGIMLEGKVRRESKRRSVSSRRLSSRRLTSAGVPSPSSPAPSITSVGSPGSLTSIPNGAGSPMEAAKAWATQAASASEWLSPMRTLAYYDFDPRRHNLRLALRPRELFVILPNGKEIMLSVGFEESVSAVIKLVLVHLEGESGANFSLFSGETLLSRRKKLRDVGVKPGDHLILRQEDESAATANDDQDMEIWVEPQTDEYLLLDTPRAIAAGILSPDATPTVDDTSTSLNNSGEIPADSSATGDAGDSSPKEKRPAQPIPSSFSTLSGTSTPTRYAHIVNAISLNKIIERLTHPSDMESDFLDIFITTYRSFTTPEQVMSKVMQRYAVPEKIGDREITDREADMIRLRCCVFLKEWLDRSFADIDEVSMEKMNIWVENDVAEDRRPLLLNALNKVRTRKMATQEVISPVSIDIPELGNRVSLMDLDPAEIARQLTIYTSTIFRAIKPYEFFDCAWSKTKLQHLAPNVMEMISRFNYISSWVATELCCELQLRVRRTKFVKIVRVATVLRDMNNFHMLYAFVSGWNNSAVQRLKVTIEKLPRQTKTAIAELETLMSMEGSFKNYREAVKRVGNGPCIPYSGIVLKDLTFIEDGNPNISNGLINWYKRRLVHGVIGDYLRSALVPCRFAPVIVNGIPIANIINQLPALDGDPLFDASLKAEPRGVKAEQLA